MPLWRRYWMTTLLWALGAAVLSTLHGLAATLSGPYDGGWFGIWATLRVLPNSFALFVPLTAFAGAVAASRMAGASGGAHQRRSVVGLAFATGVLTFGLVAYVAPWLEALTLQIALGDSSGQGTAWQVQTWSHWREVYVHLLDAARATAAAGQPEATEAMGVAYRSGVRYYLPIAAAAVGALVTALGFAVGARTRAVSRPVVAHAHHWLAALVVVVGVAVSMRSALLLSGRHVVPPEVTAPLIPLVPALLLLGQVWTSSVSRRSDRFVE